MPVGGVPAPAAPAGLVDACHVYRSVSCGVPEVGCYPSQSESSSVFALSTVSPRVTSSAV